MSLTNPLIAGLFPRPDGVFLYVQVIFNLGAARADAKGTAKDYLTHFTAFPGENTLELIDLDQS